MDVSDTFYFLFLLGEGEGEFEAPGGRVGSFIENPGRGVGGFPGRGWGQGAGRVSAANWVFF